MADKNQIKANEINAPIYQDSTVINSPGVALRMVKGNPQMVQAFMDEIASAVTEQSDDYKTTWTLCGGKAELRQEPNPVSLYEEEKRIGVIVDPEERRFFEEWIRQAVRTEDVEIALARFKEDGSVDIERLKLNPDNWVKKCEFGVLKVEQDGKVYKQLEDMVYYDNLFITNRWKEAPGALILSTLNADRGFRPVFIKMDSGDLIFKFVFHPSCWDDLKWYSRLQVRLLKPATVYFRFADDQFYVVRKTILPEWSLESNVDYEDILKMIADVERIQERFHVNIGVNEKLDERQYEFIKLMSNSIQEQLTEYEWEAEWFSIRPTGVHLDELVQKGRDEEFSFVYQESVTCEFESAKFDRYRCSNIIESARIVNYDEIQRQYKEHFFPIVIKLNPGKSKKWYRILELPGQD